MILYGTTSLERLEEYVIEGRLQNLYETLHEAIKEFNRQKRGVTTPLLLKFDEDSDRRPHSLDHLIQIACNRPEIVGESITLKLPQDAAHRVIIINPREMTPTAGSKYAAYFRLINYLRTMHEILPSSGEEVCAAANDPEWSTRLHTNFVMADAYLHQLSSCRSISGFTRADEIMCGRLTEELRRIFALGRILEWEGIDNSYFLREGQ